MRLFDSEMMNIGRDSSKRRSCAGVGIAATARDAARKSNKRATELLGLSRNADYIAKTRVLARLREILDAGE